MFYNFVNGMNLISTYKYFNSYRCCCKHAHLELGKKENKKVKSMMQYKNVYIINAEYHTH